MTSDDDQRRRQAYLSSLVEHASDVIMVLDAMLRVRYASPSTRDIVGHDAEALTGRTLLEVIHPEEREEVADRLMEVAHAEGARAYVELRVVDAAGAERRVEATATDLLDHPATNGIVVNLRDLSGRDQAREALAASERRFRKLIANISDTITLVDATGRVLLVTGDATDVLGYPDGYWPGRSVLDGVHPEDRARAAELQQAVLDHPGEPLGGQFRMRQADGDWADAEVTIVNLLDDPDVACAVITSRNITPHKTVERALSEAHSQALDALAARAEFVAQVGHEVRTPLHGIVGLAELLADAPLDEESRRLVAAIRRSGEALSQVIEDLLDYSKVEAGHIELVDGVLSPHRLAADVIDILSPQAAERGLSLDGQVDARVPPFVRGDELRLRQVLVNLVANAVKYTDEGGVTVSLTADDQDGGVVVVRAEVVDTGLGIPAEEIPHLFQPFMRSRATTASGRPGTGLGLTVARQLVELMGGEIGVTSEVGSGTTVWFSWPTVPARPDDLSLGPRPVTLRRRAQGARVLVVEDSPVNQVLVERQLIRLGMEVVVASGGREALGLMDQMAFDVVLLDWQLPDMDGLEVARRRRAHEARVGGRVPIVAMTGTTGPDVPAAAAAAGMDDFLAKPARLEEVAEVLNRVLGAVDEARAAAAPAPSPVLLDSAALAALVDDVGDRAIAASVVVAFLGELDGRLAALASSGARGDHEVLERTAHTLKSTSAALGAVALAEATGRLEAAAAAGSADTASLVAEVTDVARATGPLLRRELQVMQA